MCDGVLCRKSAGRKREASPSVVVARHVDHWPRDHVASMGTQAVRFLISLLYGFGCSIDVPMQELRKLLAGSRGEVIVARRLTHEEAVIDRTPGRAQG
jgi:hypothetical protein